MLERRASVGSQHLGLHWSGFAATAQAQEVARTKPGASAGRPKAAPVTTLLQMRSQSYVESRSETRRPPTRSTGRARRSLLFRRWSRHPLCQKFRPVDISGTQWRSVDEVHKLNRDKASSAARPISNEHLPRYAAGIDGRVRRAQFRYDDGSRAA